jgi:iron complex transport system ATP-binding protein
MNPNAAISLAGLSFGYEPAAPDVLQDVSLDLPAGAVTALLGPNGSGKTTLLHLILGLLEPRTGQIHIGGRAQASYSRREMSRQIGLVPQSETLTFNLNVLEYVLLGRAPYLGLLAQPDRDDQRAAFAALEAAGLEELWQRSTLSLSGGEKQLAAISRALAQQPHILLLDEPTVHLDIANARRIARVIRRLRDRGRTVVFSTHAPNAAAALADYVVLLKEGRVLAAGPAGAVLTAARLSATYGVEIEVIQAHGRPLVLTDEWEASPCKA